MKFARMALAAALLVAVSACAQLGLAVPQTFNEKTAVAYLTVTEVRTTATSLLQTGTITKADAINVEASADTARQGIDVAREIHKSGDVSTAEGRLVAVRTALTALQTYLAARKK